MYRARKKNIANIANETMNATTLAPKNVRERKKSKSTIGARRLRSITTNAASETSASANRPSTRAEAQPHELLWMSPSTSAPSAIVSVVMPGRSTSRTAVSSRDSRAASRVTAIATIATGTFRKKIDCQLTSSDEEAADDGPDRERHRRDARPGADRPAALAGGNVFVMIDRVAGIMSPEPTPWTARNTTAKCRSGPGRSGSRRPRTR